MRGARPCCPLLALRPRGRHRGTRSQHGLIEDTPDHDLTIIACRHTRIGRLSAIPVVHKGPQGHRHVRRRKGPRNTEPPPRCCAPSRCRRTARRWPFRSRLNIARRDREPILQRPRPVDSQLFPRIAVRLQKFHLDRQSVAATDPSTADTPQPAPAAADWRPRKACSNWNSRSPAARRPPPSSSPRSLRGDSPAHPASA